ncbi:GNAT family N-acetyltransferase [Palleronia sp. KMU-117]|uniref:GNAT family N-acetyltransferase n=1 Tax=Palleronia sp. KMU-117 TaxID=3434108 RepID=UPI003D76448D
MGFTRAARYRWRHAASPEDIAAAQALRHRAFRGGDGTERDADAFDAICTHVLVEDLRTGALVCCFRILPLAHGGEIGRSYSAQHYGLSALSAYPGRMIELGRFCVAPGVSDPDVLRVAWGAVARLVEDTGVEMLFGCSSFRGTDALSYADAFAMLKAHHLAPPRWLPQVKAPDVFRFARRLRRAPDVRRALLTMPPLLRSYLAMGGWVSDHAVVDRDLNTLHVFTGLEIGAIPPARARALRALAG